MHGRCNSPGNTGFARYGGAGIKICARWRKFENFYADMGERPEGKTLDRIDGSKGYEPGNCRWATRAEQANNTRTNRRLSFQGRTQTLTQWAVELGVRAPSLQARLHRGWSAERALTTPMGPARRTKLNVAIPAGYRLHPAIMAELAMIAPPI
jgi:hypothetical protein